MGHFVVQFIFSFLFETTPRVKLGPFPEASAAVVFAGRWNEPAGPPGPSSCPSWRPPGTERITNRRQENLVCLSAILWHHIPPEASGFCCIRLVQSPHEGFGQGKRAVVL